jgi:hypothetical protein
MATSDPLPEAFAATIGHLLRLDGRVGVAALLTFVVEIMSCFGFAALSALKREQGRDSRSRDEGASRREIDQGYPSGRTGGESPSAGEMAPPSSLQNVPQTSRVAGNHDAWPVLTATMRKEAERPSNVVPISLDRGRETLPLERSGVRSTSTAADIVNVGAQVAEFARVRLHSMAGASLRASELRAAYEVWCSAHGHEPVSQQRLGAELTGLGLARRKSCGLVRYRDVQLAA